MPPSQKSRGPKVAESALAALAESTPTRVHPPSRFVPLRWGPLSESERRALAAANGRNPDAELARRDALIVGAVVFVAVVFFLLSRGGWGHLTS